MRALANLSIVLGVMLIAAYVWAAVIEPWGEPDQSRLFWYAFLALFGLVLIRAGIRTRRRNRD